MSTAIEVSDGSDSLGFPELTPLGKQIEVLRIGRGLSKQHLARYAGTSRQQLWRVMTGKSELTGPLRLRLAEALRVSESLLSGEPAATASTSLTGTLSATLQPVDSSPPTSLSTDDYLSQPETIEHTLRTMPNGDDARELKRAFLNALEELALKNGVLLPPAFFDLRRRVFAGEL